MCQKKILIIKIFGKYSVPKDLMGLLMSFIYIDDKIYKERVKKNKNILMNTLCMSYFRRQKDYGPIDCCNNPHWYFYEKNYNPHYTHKYIYIQAINCPTCGGYKKSWSFSWLSNNIKCKCFHRI